MMDRRNFIASTAVLGVTSLVGIATAKESEGTADVNPDLTGVWVDPFLQQPSTIIIESDQSGSNVQVMGTYWHKNHGQVAFHGTGTLKSNLLSISYKHPNVDDLGSGVIKMELTKVEKTLVLQGKSQKSDGSWSAQDMRWYKQRR